MKNKKGCNKDEMLSEACFGFLKGVKCYDLKRVKECSLKTHVVLWINGALIAYIKDQMHEGYKAPRCLAPVRQCIQKLSSNRNTLSSSDISSVANEFELSKKQVLEIELFYCHSENLNFENWELEHNPINNDSLMQTDKDKVSLLIHHFVDAQAEPVSSILKSRWLVDKKLSLLAIGKQFNHSYEKIRQIEIAAFERLMVDMKTKAVVI